MQASPLFRTAATVLLVAAVAALFTSALSGCAPLKAVDEAIWGTNTAPAEPEPGSAPPVVEIVATALATIGYGGMYAWIRRIKSSGLQATTQLTQTVAKLQGTLDGMNGKT
jgi:hypothetical protein